MAFEMYKRAVGIHPLLDLSIMSAAYAFGRVLEVVYHNSGWRVAAIVFCVVDGLIWLFGDWYFGKIILERGEEEYGRSRFGKRG